MADARVEFVATGGNRHPSAADWSGEHIAYGAGNNIALWNPEQGSTVRLLQGHTKHVNAVRYLKETLISGSSDSTIKLWRKTLWKTLEAKASINVIAVLPEQNIFASGAADGTVKVWKLDDDVELVQEIKVKFIPLALALVTLGEDIVLAVAGTTNTIQIYAKNKLQATLTGHDGWIRSLDFHVSPDVITLASASQDRFVRLWRMQQSVEQTLESLSNKVHKICGWTLAYDALLVGHEDWVYTARWHGEALLTASADNSLAIWRREASGLWISETRLGEISSLKGSTTATGSTGGFWNGLWSADGKTVISLSGTGSWRRWTQEGSMWQQQIAISGHVKEVQSVAWAPDGSYLLSTSSDQTTRLWAEWDRDGSWHEMARPQIHGYDLNCIAAVTRNQFISGADEKLLRVFNKPKDAERLLKAMNAAAAYDEGLPASADIPVLGLSNKTISEDVEREFDQPPLEDALARTTLWPEHEKLYGHGYEISCVAVGDVVATACKASTLDHAVIRLYETVDWREIKPPLAAHTLTITSLAFSEDSKHLLSVGRDRQWVLWKRGETWTQIATGKHTRMILGCAWYGNTTFATAGRDKTIKVWKISETVENVGTVTATSSVTAVAFSQDGRLVYGTEDGDVILVSTSDWKQSAVDKTSGAITSLAWRPATNTKMLAVASEDTTVRLYTI